MTFKNKRARICDEMQTIRVDLTELNKAIKEAGLALKEAERKLLAIEKAIVNLADQVEVIKTTS